ncbi:hypothetical protein RCL1_004886 [Eukaryota sp. TZLM3-RCL]
MSFLFSKSLSPKTQSSPLPFQPSDSEDEQEDFTAAQLNVHIALNDLLKSNSELLSFLISSLSAFNNISSQLSPTVSALKQLYSNITSLESNLVKLFPALSISYTPSPPSPSSRSSSTISTALRNLRLSPSVALPLADVGLRTISYRPIVSDSNDNSKVESLVRYRREIVSLLAQQSGYISSNQSDLIVDEALSSNLSMIVNLIDELTGRLASFLDVINQSNLIDRVLSKISQKEGDFFNDNQQVEIENLAHENSQLRQMIIDLKIKIEEESSRDFSVVTVDNRQSNEELQREIDELNQSVEDLTGQLSIKTDLISKFEKDREKFTSKISELTSEMSKKDGKISNYEDQILELNKELSDTQSNLIESKKNHSEMITDQNTENLIFELSLLRNELLTKQEEIEKKDEIIHKLNQKSSQLNSFDSEEVERLRKLVKFHSSRASKLEDQLTIALNHRKEAELLLSEQNIELARLSALVYRS